MKNRLACILLCVAAVFIPAPRIYAQSSTGTIVGHIKDSQGAAVVNATVTVTNVDTREARTISSDSAGDYTVPLLKPGNYKVRVSSVGFKNQDQTGIVLNTDQTVRVETALAAGGATETVNVSADALSLDTDTGTIGQLITGAQISELPLNGRNFQDLLFLSPGAVNNAGGEQTVYRISVSGTGVSSVSLGGSRGSSEGYTVDGTTILDIAYDTSSFSPSLDDISEFNELTKSYSAAYGYSLNQINLTSKSGTNSYHGSVFEFLRNSAVDAPFHGYDPTSGGLPLLRQNQFGYSLGGPVRIPKLYNGRDKTFFFANYEGFRQNTGGQSSPASVPLADEMNAKFDANVLGNFTTSQLGAGGSMTQCGVTYHIGDPHPLFNPFDPNGCPFAAAADGSYTIPSASISSLGKIIMRPGVYYPAGPNTAGTSLGVNNFVYPSTHVLSYDQQNYRIDQNIGAKDQIFFHAVKHDETTSGSAFSPVNATTESQPGRLYTMTETHTFSSRLTNQFRLGYNESAFVEAPSATITSADLASLNWPNPFTAAGQNYPRLEFDTNNFNDGITYGGGGAFFGSVTFANDSIWDLNESASWTVKRHTLNFGIGYRRYRLTLNPGDDGLGRVNYNGQYSGDVFADALLGAGAGIALTELGPLSNPARPPEAHLHFNWLAPYVQDDWKVNDKLTLNLGLRYEFIATPFEEQNSFVWPDFSAPGGALYIANAKIAQAYGGVNPFSPSTGLYIAAPGGERGPGPAPKDQWAPRLGFAYRLFGDDKTIMRGGFGKYFDTIEANEYQASSAGIYPNTSSVSTGTDAARAYPAAFNTNSLPKAASGAAPLVSYYTDPSTSTLGFIQVQSGHTLNPYYFSWNLGIERELPRATKLEVDYVANHGTHLFSRSNPNAPTQCIAVNGCTVTTTTGPTIAPAARTPYQNLGTLVYAGFDGISNYNALDVKVEHRASDLDLVVAYTWAQALDTKSAVAGLSGDSAGWAGPQDGHNINADYARGDYDVGQRLAISAVYPLPVGRGRKFLTNSPRFVDEAVGGWKFGVISSFQGGLPFSVNANDIQGANQTFSERANYNPGASKGKRTLNNYFSYDATPGSVDAEFTQPLPGYFGNSARNAIRGPGQINADLSLAKNFPLWEKAGFEFRFDGFNAFNHWNPGSPGSNVNGGASTAVIFPTNSQSSARILQISGRISF